MKQGYNLIKRLQINQSQDSHISFQLEFVDNYTLKNEVKVIKWIWYAKVYDYKSWDTILTKTP